MNHDFIVGALRSEVTAAVLAGLLVGKVIGITAAAFLVVRFGLGHLPAGTSWAMMSGLGMLGGIGFTVSLFIGALSFPGSEQFMNEAKAGTFTASVLAALLGAAILCCVTPRPKAHRTEARIVTADDLPRRSDAPVRWSNADGANTPAGVLPCVAGHTSLVLPSMVMNIL